MILLLPIGESGAGERKRGGRQNYLAKMYHEVRKSCPIPSFSQYLYKIEDNLDVSNVKFTEINKTLPCFRALKSRVGSHRKISVNHSNRQT